MQKIKINGIPKDYDKMPFGRQIEYRRVIEAFKSESKKTWISQKRISSGKALKDAIKLYEAKEYYCNINDSENYRDDSFEFWYKTA